MGKRITGIMAALLCMASVASAQTVVSDVVGFQKVEIPPAGGVSLIGFSFTSDQPLYLDDVFGTNQLVRNNRSRNADKIYIWNGTVYDNFFQKDDGFFYDVLDSSGDPVVVEIESGTAMFIQSPSSAVDTNTISLSGVVLMTNSVPQEYAGLIAIANPYPTDLDLNSIDFDWSTATANSRSRNADKVYIWNADSVGYDSFYLDENEVWQAVLAETTSDPIIPAGGGAFYEAKNSFSNEIFKTFN